jgi:type IV pilus assembly protein PilE
MRGFTLIELLLVLVIMGILAALALVSWQSHLLRARRVDAAASLVELAGWLERNAATSNRYDVDANGAAVVLPFAVSPRTGSAFYDLALTATATGFTVTATPREGRDPECAMLGLDATGTQTATGSLGAAACWNPQ